MERRWMNLGILVILAVLSVIGMWMIVGLRTIYENFDGPYYGVIAKCGYDKECIGTNFSFPLPLEYYPAHFPLYPLLVRSIGQIGHINLLQAGVIVNLVAAVGAVVVLYKLVEENEWGSPAWICLAWLFWWPRMWAVRAVGSPETLLALGIFGSWYFFLKKRYMLAALFGAGAVLAKPPGILLFVAYSLQLMTDSWKARRIDLRVWPLILMPATLVGLFWFYGMQTGDFWAYFHSGDNIHLQWLPFKIFDTSQSWVGTFWLEDVVWIYLVGAVGVIRAFKRSSVLGLFGAVFYVTILFVSHRDIARYSLPIVPVVLIGFSEIWKAREVRWMAILLLIPLFFYSANFLAHNRVLISDWTPFVMFSR